MTKVEMVKSEAAKLEIRAKFIRHKFETQMNDEATRLEIACVTYIQGFADSAALTQGLCVKGVSIGALTKEYLTYMERHPQMLDQHKALGLAASIREAHPCSAK